MTFDNFKQILTKYILEYGIDTEERLQEFEKTDTMLRLYQYMEYILEINNHINVTAIKEEEGFIKKHIIDSLYVNKALKKANIDISNVKKSKKVLLDIGTGGGFPLIPLKIYWQLSGKAAYGLDKVLKKLKVINDKEEIAMLHERAEILAHDKEYREQFELVTTRAVSNIENVLEYMTGFVKVAGYAVLMRGKKEEISNDLLKKYSFKKIHEEQYKLFEENRSLIILEKLEGLSKKLPTTNSKIYKDRSAKANFKK